MPKRKPRVTATVRVKVYPVLERAVEVGVARGYRRAHKHLDAGEHATEAALCEEQRAAIMNELCEALEFDE